MLLVPFDTNGCCPDDPEVVGFSKCHYLVGTGLLPCTHLLPSNLLPRSRSTGPAAWKPGGFGGLTLAGAVIIFFRQFLLSPMDLEATVPHLHVIGFFSPCDQLRFGSIGRRKYTEKAFRRLQALRSTALSGRTSGIAKSLSFFREP